MAESHAPHPEDLAAVAEQLQRIPRGVRRVAHRCECSLPDVIETSPRLDDGSPFPTLYYLTCPRINAAIGTLEATGVMRELEAMLDDPDIAAAYRSAHDRYLADRDSIEVVEEISNFSGGGMPTRVKCLHVLVAHSLAAGPGVNPLGDLALSRLPRWWSAGPCVQLHQEETS